MNQKASYSKPFVTITFLFFMWGFITVMNDVLIPHLKAVFDLSFFQAGLVQFAFFGAFFVVSLIYFIISVVKGDPISKIGYKNGIIVGLVLCGIGCMLFVPAATNESYAFFLSALFVLASGVTVLQIAANPYVARLGKPETASSRLNLSQGFNSLGTTLAPFVGALLIYKVFNDGATVAVSSLQLPYLIYGGVFIALALLVWGTSLPTLEANNDISKGLKVLQNRQLLYGLGAIFTYVGAEVAIGSFLINYFALDNIMGLDEAQGGIYLSYYWGGAMIGRFLGALSMSEISDKTKKYGAMAVVSIAVFLLVYLVTAIRNEDGQFYMEFLTFDAIALYLAFLLLNYVGFFIGKANPSRILVLFASIVILLLLVVVFGGGPLAFWSAIAIGLFNSIMWSNIFTLAIDGLGNQSSQGSSLLVMMIVGGALIPPLQGALADTIGIQKAFFLPIVCYVYIVFYGLNGYKKRA